MVENMEIWNAVSCTDPKHTKHVNQRGGFTAIGANYQIKCVTEQFGPCGIGWGYESLPPIFTPDNMVIVPVTLWHGERGNVFGPEYGCAELVSDKGRRDSDAPKKATTDALTKLLSRLGFNADVFMGLFDDNKYVAEMEKRFAAKPATITEEQRTELVALFEATGTNPKPYMDRAAANAGVVVNDLRDLPAAEFTPLSTHLKSKPQKEAA